MHFQVRHSLPAPSVPLRQIGLHAHTVLKQMTLGFPTIDHNKKNTPTAYCSHLPLERHPLSLFFFSLVCFSTHLQKHSYPSLFLQLVIFMLWSCVPRLPSLSNWAVTESCFSAFSTTESSLCQGAKEGGGGLSGWAHSKGAKWKEGMGGGVSGRSHQVARV